MSQGGYSETSSKKGLSQKLQQIVHLIMEEGEFFWFSFGCYKSVAISTTCVRYSAFIILDLETFAVKKAICKRSSLVFARERERNLNEMIT